MIVPVLVLMLMLLYAAGAGAGAGADDDRAASVCLSSHWNDPDLLVIGNPGTSTVEQITQMSLWCLTKAPLIISTDLRSASNTTIQILSNPGAIAVNQDSLGIPGQLVRHTEAGGQVWTGELSGGRYAAVLVNLLDATSLIVELVSERLRTCTPLPPCKNTRCISTAYLTGRGVWKRAR